MTRFNYLTPSRRTLADVLRNLEITAATRRALAGVAGAVVLAAATVAYESAMLSDAQRDERAVMESARAEDANMASARAVARDTQQMYGLAQTIRSVQASGALRATLIAEIGDRLPPSVWIKEISRDDSGILVLGEAAGYGALAQALTSLEHAHTVAFPVLRQAQRTGDGSSDLIAYELHVQERAR